MIEGSPSTDRTWVRPRPLQGSDDTQAFTCGQPVLDRWFAKYALMNHRAGSTRVFVSPMDDARVAGFYALSAGAVVPVSATPRVSRGQASREIPVVLLTRLAVDSRYQGYGLGRALLLDALGRVSRLSEELRIRALLIHTKDESARDFYTSVAEFEPSPTDPIHIFLLMKDLRKAARQ